MTGIVRIDPDTRGHRYKIFKPHAQKRIRCHCLSVCAIDDWNKLPDPICDVKSVNEFKASLDEHWMREQYNLPV